MRINLPALWEGSEFQRASKYAESAAGRVRNAQIIVTEFLKSGFPLGVALAAVVNARHESDLSNAAVGDSGHSVGLFQLYDSGAGKGMTVEERMDPYINTRRIIEETEVYGNKTYRDGRLNLMDAYDQGASVSTLALIFGRDIERPANKGAGRDKTARSLFPAIADLPAKTLTRAAVTGVVVATSLSVAAAGVLIYFLWRWRKNQ